MLYSQTLEDRQFTFFRSMLRHVLDGEANYKQFVDPVISDAKGLLNGSKSLYNINRDNYYIIVFLSEQGKDFFNKIDMSDIQMSDYVYIEGMITQQRQLSFA